MEQDNMEQDKVYVGGIPERLLKIRAAHGASEEAKYV
ncbi:hypothetical protein GGR07_000422 [Bacteroides pyogenes]|nr:hypothetical protein [Bacteroides pyogenes]